MGNLMEIEDEITKIERGLVLYMRVLLVIGLVAAGAVGFLLLSGHG